MGCSVALAVGASVGWTVGTSVGVLVGILSARSCVDVAVVGDIVGRAPGDIVALMEGAMLGGAGEESSWSRPPKRTNKGPPIMRQHNTGQLKLRPVEWLENPRDTAFCLSESVEEE